MTQGILVLNSGSSSLKFGVFVARDGDEAAWLSGSAKGIGRANGSLSMRSSDGAINITQDHLMESQHDALQRVADALAKHLREPLAGVGHRVVHGGPHVRSHCKIDVHVKDALREAVPFAPLHLPQSLALIDDAQRIFSGVPHFACFDTVFHRTMPERATRFALPRDYAEHGILRYGFHGLSYESIVNTLGAGVPSRMVIAHLGSGSSLCALKDGRSVDTSMGMTPAGGIPMATRSGDIDPGVLIHLLRNESLNANALETLVNRASGLKALSDSDDDMEALLTRRDQRDANAALAIDVFCTAIRKTIGAYAALLGGVDLIVFSGGIGEHAEAIREQALDGLGFLHAEHRVVATDEERQIARHCRRMLSE
ncbi:acetate/propionate family kinase [Caballeronia concitans]|uniref:Acetate kinase n=1 Tax=Caballeronia concitans TaxID=1777133 RepID=A0A658QW14_9BURK|nr:acetate/propionate family kinase [Caballeronia concitans]KIG03704.1 Acetate kinase [Burkholderia sp. MR1]SAL27722.1 acetate kinase [Caballeronia concitans]